MGSVKKRGGRRPLAGFPVRPDTLCLIGAILGFIAGQGIYLAGIGWWGLLLSALSMLFGLAMLVGKGKFLKELSLKAPSRKASAKGPGGPLARPWWILLVLPGLVLAGIAQYHWLRGSNLGLWLYLAACLFFLAGFWPWTREGLQRVPLTPKVEAGIFLVILALAAFLRTWRIGEIPSGLFIDQGFQGHAALRILHEGWRPFYVEEIFHAYSLALFQLAGWFGIFGATEVTLKLFYVALSLVGFPFIYWTFRQLSGPRVALLAFFILAVMRWHINFSRNGFPTIQLPLYAFAMLAFLLYGIRTGKRWAFVTAAFFFAGGFYTYQAFKVVPILLLVYGLYEAMVGWKDLRRRWRGVLTFLVAGFVLSFPVFNDIVLKSNPGTREAELSILKRCQAEGSLKPLWHVMARTALMFNRQGDPNPRHNLQDHRMLDDVSGALFVLGLAYAAFRIRRRKYFYAVAGFLVMSLPCVLSIDAAHANRMLGTTPFTAFLIAVPLAALWGRARALAGKTGEWVFLGALVLPLGFMVQQNFDIYFNKQAKSLNSWAEYSIVESTIGRAVAEKGEAYEHFISPRFYNHFTLNFYSYDLMDQVHGLAIPESLVPTGVPGNRGLFFALESGREGLLDLLGRIYPEGRVLEFKDPIGQVFLRGFEVPADVWSRSKGMTAEFAGKAGEVALAEFPKGLPEGPYSARFKGTLLIPRTGSYSFAASAGVALWQVDRKAVAGKVHLLKGYHSIVIDWQAPSGPAAPGFSATLEGGTPFALDASRLTSLKVPLGLRASYHSNWGREGAPLLEQMEPPPYYVNGNDFPLRAASVIWEGTLRIPETATYHFAATSNVPIRLWVDGVEKGFSEGGLGPFPLAQGPHSFKLQGSGTLTQGGVESMVLKWKAPRRPLEAIPASAFK